MWYGRHGRCSFRFGFPPFGFWFHGVRPFPRRQEYLEMLEEYKKELEEELKEVTEELEDLKKA
jgi:hypothetical protein